MQTDWGYCASKMCSNMQDTGAQMQCYTYTGPMQMLALMQWSHLAITEKLITFSQTQMKEPTEG